jgi:hypothetical protein
MRRVAETDGAATGVKEVIKEVERICSACCVHCLKLFLLQGSAVDITHFVYNSLIVPGGASNLISESTCLDCLLSMLDVDHYEGSSLYLHEIC